MASKRISDPARPWSRGTTGPGAGLSRIVTFAALMLALALGLDAAVDAGLRSITTSKFGSMNRVMSGAVGADIVVSGSSRALVHYDPRVIERATGLSAYNIGMNGVLIDVQAAMLKAYLARNRAPRLVVHNLDAFSLKTTNPGEIYDPPVYVPYLDSPELYRGLAAIDPSVWKWRHIPLYGYTVEDIRFTWARGLLALAGVQPPEDYVRGFNPRNLAWTEEFEAFRTSRTSGVVYPVERSGVAALETIVETSKRAGAELVLVYAPEYVEAQQLVRNRSRIFATFRDIADRNGVQLWDYSGSPLSVRRSLFYNSQHLNADGAALFSAAVAERLDKLLGRRRERLSPPY